MLSTESKVLELDCNRLSIKNSDLPNNDKLSILIWRTGLKANSIAYTMNASFAVCPHGRFGSEKCWIANTFHFFGIIRINPLAPKRHEGRQIQTVCNKICKEKNSFLKFRHKLSTETVLLPHYAFIHTYLEYCNTIWAAGCTYLLECLFHKQNIKLEL